MNFLFGRYLANWLTLSHCIRKKTYEDYSLRQMWVYVHGSSTSPGKTASSPSSPTDILLPLTPSWSQASDLSHSHQQLHPSAWEKLENGQGKCSSKKQDSVGYSVAMGSAHTEACPPSPSHRAPTAQSRASCRGSRAQGRAVKKLDSHSDFITWTSRNLLSQGCRYWYL